MTHRETDRFRAMAAQRLREVRLPSDFDVAHRSFRDRLACDHAAHLISVMLAEIQGMRERIAEMEAAIDGDKAMRYTQTLCRHAADEIAELRAIIERLSADCDRLAQALERPSGWNE